jgi:hypothetical protein
MTCLDEAASHSPAPGDLSATALDCDTSIIPVDDDAENVAPTAPSAAAALGKKQHQTTSYRVTIRSSHTIIQDAKDAFGEQKDNEGDSPAGDCEVPLRSKSAAVKQSVAVAAAAAHRRKSLEERHTPDSEVAAGAPRTPRNQIVAVASEAASSGSRTPSNVPRVASLMNRQAKERVVDSSIRQQQKHSRQQSSSSSAAAGTPIKKRTTSNNSALTTPMRIAGQPQTPDSAVAKKAVASAGAAAVAKKAQWNSAPTSSPRGGSQSGGDGALTPRGMSDEHRKQVASFIERRSILYAWNKKLRAEFFNKKTGETTGPSGV